MRAALLSLMGELAERDGVIARQGQEVVFKQALIDKLTHENALLKRMKFAAQSERFSAEQKSLLDESLDEDLQAVADEIEQATPPVAGRQDKQVPKRTPLPANLPRREIRHELDSTTCACGCQMKRIGEDVAEKLDYVPGVFTVERHIRGKWACAKCETIIQVPVGPHVIDKGIPTTGLLAQVLVAKYADHLPLYRQEAIFGRAGLAIPRSTLAQWVGSCGVQLQPLVDALRAELLQHRVLHADETPVAMLKPGNGKTHRAYLWAYATGAFENTRAVVYDFCESRAGEHARTFLGTWKGNLVCDDFSGYKALLTAGVTEVGCLAHYLERGFIWSAAASRQCLHGRTRVRTPYKVHRSQRLQEREQVSLGFPRPCVRRFDASLLPERLHGVAFHLQVGRDVPPCRGDAGMAQVVANHRHVGARLQQRHGAAMAKDVRCDVFALQRRIVASCSSRVLGKNVGHAIARQRLTKPIDEHALPT